MPLITFGHGTASAERITELLRSAGVPHQHGPGVRLRADGLLVYDGGQQPLELP